MDLLTNTLKNTVKNSSIDLFGVADLTDPTAHDFILRQGGEHISTYPRGVSLGLRLVDAVINELYRHEEPTALYTYRGLYNSANDNLDRAALLIAKRIQEAGYHAYPIPASQTINTRRLEAAISHKLVANLAGLGWIGKNCLLITPEFGPRIRLVTILTDALFEPDRPLKNKCGDCTDCIDACPPGAFTGVQFNSSEPRDIRFRAHTCRDYTQRRAQLLGEGICGLCVYSCPYGSQGTL